MLSKKNKRIYTHQDTEANFPLGGIGTGTISIDSRGRLNDFELFNKPDKGNDMPYSFFALHTEPEDSKESSGSSVTRVLEAEMPKPYSHSHGFHAWNYRGAPRFRESLFKVRYPLAELELEDPDVPFGLKLEAFSPFVPLDSDRSGIPAIYFRWTVKNLTLETQKVTLAFSAANLAGWVNERDVFTKPLFAEGSYNTFFKEDWGGGIFMKNRTIPQSSTDFTEMGIAAMSHDGQLIQAKENWQEGQWWDGMQDFWNDFSESGLVRSTDDLVSEKSSVHHSPFTIGSIALSQSLAPGEESDFTFLYFWNHPNRVRGWVQNFLHKDAAKGGPDTVIRNYYAHWKSLDELLNHLVREGPNYRNVAHDFVRAWYGSDVPEPIKDAVGAGLTVIRSQTCFRVEGGKFFAFEGCFDAEGSCPGNCTHVWNYAQTLAYFFPDLERSMRDTEYLDELDSDGKMHFRAMKFLEGQSDHFHPAADGQLGSLIRVYREWKISGDREWLRKLWPGVKKSMHFAKENWDLDDDGVLDAMQHNTYDIEFYGVSSFTNSIWMVALLAYAEMSLLFEEDEEATWAKAEASRCAQALEALCFNGEYYEQALDDVNRHKYQYGKGCLTDQLLGLTWGYLLGLETDLDPAHIRSAVRAIYKYNIPDALRSVANLQRSYALNDEKGLLLCTWPRGGRPRIPFVYSDEVWTGIEYAVASLLIACGLVEEGVELVTLVRDRYDGAKRNPWDESECGHHYARTLASFGTYLAYTGMRPEADKKILHWTLKAPGDYFVCTAHAWGIIHIEDAEKGLYELKDMSDREKGSDRFKDWIVVFD